MATEERSVGEVDPDTSSMTIVSTVSTTSRANSRRGKTPASKPDAGTRTTTLNASKPTVIVGDEIAEKSTSVELCKPLESITIRNMGAMGEISLLQRKAISVLLQIAQKSKDSNGLTFEVSVAEFERLIGISSTGNREYLREVVRELMAVRVEFDHRSEQKRTRAWGVARFVAEMYVEDDERIRYSFAPEMAKKLLDPDVYSRIELLI